MPPKRFLLLLLLISGYHFPSPATSAAEKSTYIVHVDRSAKPDKFTEDLHWYSSLITDSITTTDDADDDDNRILYTYTTAFHGVAARLLDSEVANLRSKPGVVAVYPETVYQLHTTRSPLFLGLEREDSSNVWPENVGDYDVVVGVLDTGIWPESPSFNDTGMGPVPGRWKGECEVGRGFERRHCNRKIVGARVFYRGYEAATGKVKEEEEFRSPRDQDGHGNN